ncbi:MAG: hypothetical protein DMG43_03450 [Acidobacteria bacterium]|nr:MAG: hypothetical protein DMG43_03450 [Acidobacteriota bacterium]
MRLRIVQRRHVHRIRSLMDVHPPKYHCLRAAAQPVAKHQDTDADQDQRPQAPQPVKRKPVEIVEKKKQAQRD